MGTPEDALRGPKMPVSVKISPPVASSAVVSLAQT
jgi:hypothetical protein